MNLDISRRVTSTRSEAEETVLVSCRVILQVNKSSLVGLDVTFQTPIEAGSIIRPFRNLVDPCPNLRRIKVVSEQPWRSFVVQTGYLGDASDRGSVENGYLNIQKVFCHESNFPLKPTHQGFTEAWNHLKNFTEEGFMNFSNQRFSSPSIREYQTSKGDSGSRKKRPEPKPILHEPKDKHDHFPRRASNDERQKTWNYLMKTTSKLQGSFCTMDLRTNPFEEGEYDVPQSTDQSKESDQHEVQDVLNILSEVHIFTILARLTGQCTGPSHMHPEWSFGWNHGQMTDFTVLDFVFLVLFCILRSTAKPYSNSNEWISS
ncbi:hypothetical protein YC2023_118135 [Brassica napus]